MFCENSFDLGNWDTLCTCSTVMTDGINRAVCLETKLFQLYATKGEFSYVKTKQ